MDNLEKFIKQNRSDLDIDGPSPKVWTKISEDLAHKPRPVRMVPITQVWKVAATFLLIIFGMLAVYLAQIPETGSPNHQITSLEMISPELAEAEGYYDQVIGQKQKVLESYDLEKINWPSNPKAELVSLQQEYEAMKKDLFKEVNPQPVTAVMIVNLRTRLEILSKELQLLEAYQKQKNKTDYDKGT